MASSSQPGNSGEHILNVAALQKRNAFAAMLRTKSLNDAAPCFLRIGR
jgi:hypothetical protein